MTIPNLTPLTIKFVVNAKNGRAGVQSPLKLQIKTGLQELVGRPEMTSTCWIATSEWTPLFFEEMLDYYKFLSTLNLKSDLKPNGQIHINSG